MNRVFSITYQLIIYILAILEDGIISLYPLFLAHVYDNQYFQRLVLVLKLILFVFVLILVFIGSISYGFIRRKYTTVQDVLLEEGQNKSTDAIEQQEQNVITTPDISDVITNDQIDNYCEFQPEVSVIISNDFPLEENIAVESSAELICYCDGSYSYEYQTGYSGFRTSDGFSKYRHCSPRRPRSGSTDSEVFAACLALQYTAKYDYNKLILYTDNSKVEQLLKRPKEKDYNDYPKFFKVLEQCHKKNDHFDIQVERVRGHPTWYEQQLCSTNREFAKVDRKVRQKRRQHEQRFYFKNNINNLPKEKFGATHITTFNRRSSSFF